MKIAQIHTYPPIIQDQNPVLPNGATQGGGETSSYLFAKKLSEKGHNVTFYCGKYKGITKDLLKISPTFRIKYVSLLIFKNMGPAMSLELFTDLLKNKYDVIQTHQIPIMFSVIGGIVARLQKKKFIMTFHGRSAIWIDYPIAMIASFLSDAITVQNKFSYDLVKTFVQEKKIQTIPHGVDTKFFYKRNLAQNFINKYKKNNEKVILFIGRLIEAKGIHILIKAFADINKENKFTKLLIVGDGPLYKKLCTLVTDLKLNENIIFTGVLPQSDLPNFYSLADVFVLPSVTKDTKGRNIPNVSENFGNVIAEAMSCKVPIIASGVGGIPYWIKNGNNGLIVEEGNIKDLYKAIKTILYSESTRKFLVTNASNDIKNKYSWDIVIKDFENLYQNV